MIKESIQQEYITLININVPDIGSAKYVQQILNNIKGEIDIFTIIDDCLTTHLHQWTHHRDRK